MPHQAVEVERCGGADIGLQRNRLRQLSCDFGGREQGALGILQAGAFRQVQHHIQLGFVVERQQLHCHVLGGEQHAGQHGSDTDHGQENPGRAAGSDDRTGEAAIQPAKAPAIRRLGMASGRIIRRTPRQFQHQPGGDDHGDEE